MIHKKIIRFMFGLSSANKKSPDTQQINPDLIQYQRRNASAVFAMLPTVALSHATLE